MKTQKIYKKLFYFMTCFIFAVLLTGCKEKENISTAFDGLSESSFLTEVKASLNNKKPIAVAFTAEWCPHCKQYKPVFFDVKNSFQDQVTFLNIDVDDKDGSAISDRFQVKGIPTTAFIRGDGSVYKMEVGEVSKEKLNEIITELIASKKKGKNDPVAPFPIEGTEETPVKAVKEKVVPVESGKVEPPQKQEESKKEEEPESDVKPIPVQEEPAVEEPEPVPVEEENDLPPQELIKENDVPEDVPTIEFPTR